MPYGDYASPKGRSMDGRKRFETETRNRFSVSRSNYIRQLFWVKTGAKQFRKDWAFNLKRLGVYWEEVHTLADPVDGDGKPAKGTHIKDGKVKIADTYKACYEVSGTLEALSQLEELECVIKDGYGCGALEVLDVRVPIIAQGASSALMPNRPLNEPQLPNVKAEQRTELAITQEKRRAFIRRIGGSRGELAAERINQVRTPSETGRAFVAKQQTGKSVQDSGSGSVFGTPGPGLSADQLAEMATYIGGKTAGN